MLQECFQLVPHQATDRKGCNCIASWKRLLVARGAAQRCEDRDRGWVGWVLESVALQACNSHSGAFIRRLCFKGDGEENTGVRKDTVSSGVLCLCCCRGDALHKQLPELIHLMVD